MEPFHRIDPSRAGMYCVKGCCRLQVSNPPISFSGVGGRSQHRSCVTSLAPRRRIISFPVVPGAWRKNPTSLSWMNSFTHPWRKPRPDRGQPASKSEVLACLILKVRARRCKRLVNETLTEDQAFDGQGRQADHAEDPIRVRSTAHSLNSMDRLLVCAGLPHRLQPTSQRTRQ